MSPILFHNYHHLQFHRSLPKQEQSLELNRAGRKDVAKFCTCAGGEYLQCICVCVFNHRFNKLSWKFLEKSYIFVCLKGYPTKIMTLFEFVSDWKYYICEIQPNVCWNICDFKTKFGQKINFVIGLKQNINMNKICVFNRCAQPNNMNLNSSSMIFWYGQKMWKKKVFTRLMFCENIILL